MRLLLSLLMLFISTNLYAADEAQDKLELTTTFIKGNKELPQTLYIVPWQNIEKSKTTPENMVLHSLYGDIFEPVAEKNQRE
jgi:hypothetical protein